MHLFYQPDISLGYLSAEESRHAVKVLRLESGDEFELTDGRGKLCSATIKEPNSRRCEFEVVRTTIIPKRDFSIHLAIAPTKNIDRIEWMVEKCVEIGIEKISFIHCKTSERRSINMERVERIVTSAMKQSQQCWQPILAPMLPFEKFIVSQVATEKYIAHLEAEQPHSLQKLARVKQNYLIIIGPEGDFTDEELNLATASDYKIVCLGPTRLRTETAGLTAVMALNLLNQVY